MFLKAFVPILSQSAKKSTIFQLSSGWGKCGIAVIRVSGNGASNVTRCLIPNRFTSPRKLSLRKIMDPTSKELIDQALVAWFPGPNSFTGEDMVELHLHGSIAVINAVQTALGKLEEFRAAEPGEFTKRAFFNGKLDLTQVEGLADLLQAETEVQRQQALRQMEGHLSQLYTKWRTELTRSLAHVEAYIDFGEDEEIEGDVLNIVDDNISRVRLDIEDHLNDQGKGERLRNGVHAAIIGEPNVGKSSLINAISGQEIAITSHIPGTTRDIVECALNIGGYPLILSDTAGIRHTEDVVEKEGVKRAVNRAQQTDLVIATFDATVYNEQSLLDLQQFYHSTQSSVPELILVLNKSDLLNDKEFARLESLIDPVKDCMVSCKSRSGLKDFKAILIKKLKILCGNPSQGSISLTQERHRYHLNECVKCFEEYGHTHQDLVLKTEHLRRATVQLGKLTGKITSEDILDVIFKDFCIGK